jgi:hypothetical protein
MLILAGDRLAVSEDQADEVTGEHTLLSSFHDAHCEPQCRFLVLVPHFAVA